MRWRTPAVITTTSLFSEMSYSLDPRTVTCLVKAAPCLRSRASPTTLSCAMSTRESSEQRPWLTIAKATATPTCAGQKRRQGDNTYVDA